MKTLLLICAMVVAFCGGRLYEVVENHNNEKDYTLDIDQRGVTLYDGQRLVGFIPSGSTPLDSLIIKDNL